MRLDKLARQEPKTSVYAICTGAGAGFQGTLWAEPGSSAYLRGASFPYATEEVDRELGFRPSRYCSEETAVDLATAAYARACRGPGTAIGIAATASVASLREHRGDHRVHACVIADGLALLRTKVLEKGVGRTSRAVDGLAVDGLCAELLEEAVGDGRLGRFSEDAAARLEERVLATPLFREDGSRGPDPLGPGLYIPGAFNPLHEGHVGMAREAERRTGMRATFCITMDHPHKPALSAQEVLRRVSAMSDHRVLVSKGDSLYLEKARRRPGSTFVIGMDALVRMLDPCWGPAVEPMLDELAALETRFLVADRTVDGRHLTLRDLPEQVRGRIFQALPGEWDVSSTEIRAASG